MSYRLDTAEECAAVPSKFLDGDFSIIQYSEVSYASITPSKSIQVVDAKLAQKLLAKHEERRFLLSYFERLQGYGSNLYNVESYSINAGCCDPRFSGRLKDDKSPKGYQLESIRAIKKRKEPSRHYLVGSNCGDVLQRSEDGYTLYTFGT